VGTRVARSLALGIGTGAPAFGPGAGVVGANARSARVAGRVRGDALAPALRIDVILRCRAANPRR